MKIKFEASIMGAVCCCLNVNDFEDYMNPTSSVYRNCICLSCFIQNILNVVCLDYCRYQTNSYPALLKLLQEFMFNLHNVQHLLMLCLLFCNIILVVGRFRSCSHIVKFLALCNTSIDVYFLCQLSPLVIIFEDFASFSYYS